MISGSTKRRKQVNGGSERVSASGTRVRSFYRVGGNRSVNSVLPQFRQNRPVISVLQCLQNFVNELAYRLCIDCSFRTPVCCSCCVGTSNLASSFLRCF